MTMRTAVRHALPPHLPGKLRNKQEPDFIFTKTETRKEKVICSIGLLRILQRLLSALCLPLLWLLSLRALLKTKEKASPPAAASAPIVRWQAPAIKNKQSAANRRKQEKCRPNLIYGNSFAERRKNVQNRCKNRWNDVRNV